MYGITLSSTCWGFFNTSWRILRSLCRRKIVSCLRARSRAKARFFCTCSRISCSCDVAKFQRIVWLHADLFLPIWFNESHSLRRRRLRSIFLDQSIYCAVFFITMNAALVLLRSVNPSAVGLLNHVLALSYDSIMKYA